MVTEQRACVTTVCVSSGVYDAKESAESAGLSMAEVIASKSPVAIHGSKVNVVYSRDHTVDNALEYAVSYTHTHTHTSPRPHHSLPIPTHLCADYVEQCNASE